MSSKEVKIDISGEQIAVTSPYNESFIVAARKIDGKWSKEKKTWNFDKRDEQRVRVLCKKIYGTDGSPVERVTVRHAITSSEAKGEYIDYAGLRVVWRHSRDEPVRFGNGVILVSGKFPGTAGSSKYPQIDGEGAVIEIRDIPKPAVLKGDEIVSGTDREGLVKEKEALLKRIAEIDEKLKE